MNTATGASKFQWNQTMVDRFRTFLFLLAFVLSSILPLVAQVGFAKPVAMFEVNSLTDRLSLDFDNLPLEEVIKYLRSHTDFVYVLDRNALDDIGIDPQTKVSLKVERIQLRSALNIITGSLALDWRVDDKQITVSTPEEIENKLDVIKYECRNLVGFPESAADYDSLIDLIGSSIAPASWPDGQGAHLAIEASGGYLIVPQTQRVHAQIAQFMSALNGLKKQYDGDPNVVITKSEFPTDPNFATKERLREKRMELEFIDARLTDVCDYLSQQSGLNIELDRSPLKSKGVSPYDQHTFRTSEAPLEVILRRLTRKLKLSFSVRDEVVWIAAQDEDNDNSSLAIYPVRDLVDVDANSRLTYDELIRALRRVISPRTWTADGGSIREFRSANALVVEQQPRVHRQIEELLRQLRKDRSELSAASALQITEADKTVQLTVYHRIDAPASPDFAFDLVRDLKRQLPELNAGDTSVTMLPGTLVVRANAATHSGIERILLRLDVWNPQPFRPSLGSERFGR
ncbi:MAG: hypothetical protein ACI9HK_003588 [Pirellulaceae bacterium]|jgi:hypothetical protein